MASSQGQDGGKCVSVRGGTIRKKVNSPGHAIKLRLVPVSPGFPSPSPASLDWAAHPHLPTKDSSQTEA